MQNKKIANGTNSSLANRSTANRSIVEEYAPRFKQKLIISALSIAFGAGLFIPDASFAADNYSVSDLQAENARLKQELEALKKGQPVNTSSTTEPASDNATKAPASSAKAVAATAENSNDSALGAVIVTSRNREEIAQDVPVPISVIGGKQLDRDRTVEVQDLTRKAPGITATTPNARRTGISIRGIGKSSSNDSMEASVGVIVDDVFMSHVGMSYQDFTDLDRVEIARGPQGTLLGKNTSIGAINYVSKAPSFTPQGSFEAETGGFSQSTSQSSPGAFKFKGSYSNAIVEDTLAYRASGFVDKQDGDFQNVNRAGGTVNEKNRYGGRVQFLFTPTDKISAKLNLDVAQSRELSNIKPAILDPLTFANGHLRTDKYTAATNTWSANGDSTYSTRLARPYFSGYTPIIGSWSQIDLGQVKPLLTNNRGASLNVNWDLGLGTLTSITAYRKFNFDSWNDSDQTRFAITEGATLAQQEQFSQEFRFTSPQSERLDYQTGLFYMHTNGESTSRNLFGQDAGAFYATTAQYNALTGAGAAGLAALKASLNNVYATSKTTPENDSTALFGQANWHLTDKATLTTGLRGTYEAKTSTYDNLASYYDGSALTSSVAGDVGGNALALRNAQLKNLTATTNGGLNETSVAWLINPSYKLNSDVLLYASAANGGKSGSVQFDKNGGPLNVAPEKTLDFELGFKSVLLNKTLLLNVNLYQTTVRDYQATTSIVDATQTTGYRSILGNIPEIRARGVELEGAFAASPRLNFNFGAAYNNAIYTDWNKATCPAEIVATLANPTCDNTGKQVVGAPKLTGIIGADYRVPLAYGLTGHAFFNTVVRSKQNLEAQLSEYGKQSGYSVTDGGIGISTAKGKTELNLVAKNLFDKEYTTSVNNFTNSAAVGYDGVGPRRYVGIVLRTNL
jgi:iron complex outermembrane receptor protein